MPITELVPPVTESQFEYTTLTTARKAKVAIDAAIPDKRMMSRPISSATAADNRPDKIAAGNTGNA